MGRMQLFELEDLPWLPDSLRDAGTDFLRTVMELAKPYEQVIPRLAEAVRASGSTSIVDLCSGGGGPIARVRKGLLEAGCDVPITMTDIYPNHAGFARTVQQAGDGVSYVAEPVDAMNVPADLDGFRTLFTSFHHFAPQDATRILEDAVEHRRGIGIFEITERKLALMLTVLITIPLALLAAPFVRPFRWSRLLWTYLPPVLPLFVWWDGFASCFRSYTVGELQAMVDGLPPNDYVWQIGREPTRPTRITYLIGYPKPA
ncbi:MAG: hypothetical protein IIA54_05975 [Chloroflexi bacterium]|nr:hypothetical protein [Chloroflexota bacterium]